MIHKLIKPVLSVALAASMFLPVAPSAFAASPQVASSPEKPLAYNNSWQAIAPGQMQWFAFKYDHAAAKDADKSSTESHKDTESHVVPADIQLYSRPVDGVTLMLLNGDQVRAWEHGQPLAHFGAATDVVDTTKKSESLARFLPH